MTAKNNPLLNWLESNTLRSIIFDFDGTLLDINEPLKRSIDEVLKENKIKYDMEKTIKEIGAVIESVQGYPLPKIILQSHQIFEHITSLSDLTFLKKLSIATKIFSKYLEYEKDAKFFPEAMLLIKELSKKYDLYIVSHNQTKNVVQHLKKENCIEYFEDVFGADELPALKPDPRALQPVVSQYNPFHGNEFLMVGDMPTDIEAGREAGVWTVAIPSGISSKDILQNCYPDLLLESLEQLMEIFGIKYKELTNSNEKNSLKIKS